MVWRSNRFSNKLLMWNIDSQKLESNVEYTSRRTHLGACSKHSHAKYSICHSHKGIVTYGSMLAYTLDRNASEQQHKPHVEHLEPLLSVVYRSGSGRTTIGNRLFLPILLGD